MKTQPVVIKPRIKIKHFDSDYHGGLDKDDTKPLTAKLHEQIGELQELLYANSTHAVLLVFQGIDASGKDGSARSVLHHVNPAGVEVANFKVPSAEERAHDFLWRIHKATPRYGNLGVFNRSHYEAVLAERVLEIVPRKVWSRRYDQIVSWERFLVENNVVVLKFFLHLGREEQAERFRERLTNPKKKWKFAEADLDVRKQWDEYRDAYEDMLNETSHPAAPWHLIPADRNWYRDHLIATTLLEAMKRLRLSWPKPKEDLSKIKID